MQDNMISFADFKNLYGEERSEEETWMAYMQYMESTGALDEAENKNPMDGMPKGVIGKSKNINSNTDFSMAGAGVTSTKHVPYAVRRGL